jgi:phospholipase C
MSSTFLPQIKNIVFLMLENRSLDDVLGWLYSGSKPRHVFPPGSQPAYDGLLPDAFYNPAYTWTGAVRKYPVVPCPDNLGMNQDRVPAYDPYEPMRENAEWNGVMNQLFGDENRIKALPAGGTPRMLGFLQDYYASYMVGWQGLDILWTYTPRQLPVLNGLAATYAVSDAWFCSVPTQTNPNRAYSICGTSLGRENNLRLNAVEQFDVPTVFNVMAGKGVTWGLYFTDVWKNKLSFTEYTFPHISKAPRGDVGSIDDFVRRAKSGQLPAFSYLEPKWGYGKGTFFIQGTDYHPPSHVTPGERFVNEIYTALRNSPQWNQLLFVITFDEHGGTYDHVAPRRGAINPDGKDGVDGFKFDLFGVRVPTILVSPYVQGGTVFRAPAGSNYPFDHTSFIKTFLKWADVDPASANLGKRMPAAPTFEGVLSNTIVNEETFAMPQMMSALDTANAGDAPAGAGHPLNDLCEGIPFSAVRAIIDASNSLPDVIENIARYKASPAAFET